MRDRIMPGYIRLVTDDERPEPSSEEERLRREYADAVRAMIYAGQQWLIRLEQPVLRTG